MLNIRPILTCEEGKLLKLTTVKGQKKANAKLVELLLSDVDLSFDGDAYIIDADSNESADELAEDIKKVTGGKLNIVRGSIGPVITAHAGPGTIGLVYVAK
jgi:fatty acid-binding protein DegV